MSQDISSRGAQQKDTWQGGIGAVQQQLNNAQDQANGQTRFIGVSDGSPLPSGATAGSLAQWSDTNNYYLSQVGAGGQYTTPLAIPRDIATTSARYITLTTTNAPPSTTDLPADGNYGWHLDTSTSAYYWAYNAAGVIVYPNFLSIAGTITGTQHSNLAAFVGTLHAFTQISGTITGAQHGNLSGTGPFHAFQGISGTITIAQHGALGNLSGTAHNAVTSTVNGFMTGTDKGILDDITNNASTPGVPLNGTAIYVNNNRVINSKQPVTAPAAPATSVPGTYDQTQINAIVLLLNDIRTQMLTVGGLFGP